MFGFQNPQQVAHNYIKLQLQEDPLPLASELIAFTLI